MDEDRIVTVPSDLENGYIGIFGLANLGNTCFFNSTLQNLLETRPLICRLLSPEAQSSMTVSKRKYADLKAEKAREREQQMDRRNKRGGKGGRKGGGHGGGSSNYVSFGNVYGPQSNLDKKLKGRLMNAFDDLVHQALVSSNTSTSPLSLLNAVVARNRFFAGRRQQDAHELLRTLIEGIREQNEKLLRSDRSNRLHQRLSQWSPEDLLQWFEFYKIEIKEEALFPLPEPEPEPEAATVESTDLSQSTSQDVSESVAAESEEKSSPTKEEPSKKQGKKGDNKGKQKQNDSQSPSPGKKKRKRAKKPPQQITGALLSQFLHTPNKVGVKWFLKCLGLPMNSPMTRRFSAAHSLLKTEKCTFYRNRYEMEPLDEDHSVKAMQLLETNDDPHQHSSIDKDKMETMIDAIFRGESESIVTCAVCNNTSKTREEFFDVSVPIENPQASASTGFGVTDRYYGSSRKQRRQQKKWGGQQQHQQQQQQAKAKAEKEKEELVTPSSPRGLNRLKGKCSILDCLLAYTDPEILSGNNKYKCRDCTITKLREEFQMNAAIKASEASAAAEAKADDKPAEAETETEAKLADNNSEKKSDTGSDDDEEEDGSLENAIKRQLSIDKAHENPDAWQEEFYIEERLINEPWVQCKAEKRILIAKPPPVLTLHLKRFEQRGYRLSKVSKQVRFPMQLDLTQFLTPEAKQRFTVVRKKKKIIKKQIPKPTTETETKTDPQPSVDTSETIPDAAEEPQSNPEPTAAEEAEPRKVEVTEEKGSVEEEKVAVEEVEEEVWEEDLSCKYQLYGIVVHHGGMGGGHYIAYTHKDRTKGPKSGWYYFSDSHFHPAQYEDVLRAEAYILFYQRCDLMPEDLMQLSAKNNNNSGENVKSKTDEMETESKNDEMVESMATTTTDSHDKRE